MTGYLELVFLKPWPQSASHRMRQSYSAKRNEVVEKHLNMPSLLLARGSPTSVMGWSPSDTL